MGGKACFGDGSNILILSLITQPHLLIFKVLVAEHSCLSYLANWKRRMWLFRGTNLRGRLGKWTAGTTLTIKAGIIRKICLILIRVALMLFLIMSSQFICWNAGIRNAMAESPTKCLTGGLLRMIASTVRSTVSPLRVFIPLVYSIMSKGSIFFFYRNGF